MLTIPRGTSPVITGNRDVASGVETIESGRDSGKLFSSTATPLLCTGCGPLGAGPMLHPYLLIFQKKLEMNLDF